MPVDVLFLCPHNAAKGVIAAAYFNLRARQLNLPLVADSAGTEPSDVVSPAVVTMLRNEGIDVSHHQPRQVMDDELRMAAYIVSMGCTAEELGLAPARLIDWSDVPAVSQDAEASREAIRAHVEALIARLKMRR
jgi:arsenate reductase